MAVQGTERAELLTIMAGRLYALQEDTQQGDALPEIQVYLITALGCLNDTATRSAALAVVRAFPTRTVAQINYIVQVAQGTGNKDIQAACGQALRNANREAPEIRSALEKHKTSPVKAIREAVDEVIT